MVLYRLSVVNSKGERQTKLVELDNELQLDSFLRISDLNIIKVDKLSSFQRFFVFRPLSERVGKKQVIEILENLRTVAASGVPLSVALVDMAESSDNAFMSNMLSDISYRMQMSMPMFEAMKKYVGIFGDTVLGLVKIGEETGELDKALKGAAQYLLRIDKMTSKIKMALITPVITLIVMLAAMFFWMIVVMPSLRDLFDTLNVRVPTMTTIFLYGSDVIMASGVYVLLVIFLAVAILVAGRSKSENFYYKTDNLLLKLPIVGRLLKYYNFAFVAEYTRLMVSSGTPLFQALDILTGTLKNAVFARGIRNVWRLMGEGKAFSDALNEQNIFPPMIVRVIGVGEQAGKLEKQLDYVSDYYYEKVDNLSANIAQMVQPVLLLILAAFFALMILSFLFPVYDMISLLPGSM